ncbi:MAG: hypothetical protein K1X29_04840 [Bdellovibrionales bacterium]|nr:hypothetical protein [Bdellovibrionales bacterium]
MTFNITLCIFVYLFVPAAMAQKSSSPSSSTEQESGKSLHYPELEVTPRASERLRIEAEREKKGLEPWKVHWAIEASALSTLVAGVTAYDRPEGTEQSRRDNNKWASQAAIGVGLGWLAITSYAALNYRPYKRGYLEYMSRPKQTLREQLITERMAEEALETPAQFGRVMQWLSVATNLGASTYIVSTSAREGRIMGFISGIVSFSPLLFPSRWQVVEGQHQIYKKKIYGPVAQFGLNPDSRGKLIPMWGLSFNW